MAAFDQVLGRKTLLLDPERLTARIREAKSVLLDVGTGEGRFVLDTARAQPDWLVIGIDPVAEAMARSSRQAGSKPAKGGAANAVFLRASAEQLPGPLASVVDRLTVNYPWGSLLRIMAAPDVDGLRRLRAACKQGAKLAVLLNATVFEDPDYLQRIGLGAVQDLEHDEQLPAAYAAGGFAIRTRRLITGDPPVNTLWGRQLVRGSDRSTLIIEAVAGPERCG